MAASSRKKMQDEGEKKAQEGSTVITGTSGSIGGELLRHLILKENGPPLVAVDRKKPSFDARKAQFYKLDLTETMADATLAEILKKEKAHTVVHCALPVTPPKNQSLAHEIISIGTMYVLNACAEAKVKKIILASTTDVYGAFPSNPNFLEEDAHSPMGDRQSPFLADKIDAEKQVLKFAKKHPGTTVTILRPCTILGPTIESYKTRFLRRSLVTTVMGFDPLIQFVHEEDVVKSFLLALEKDVPGIFNIVGDGVLPLSRVINITGKVNVRLPQIGFKTLVSAMWALDLAPAPASHVNFLRYLCVAEGRKAREKLGFTPRFTSKDALLSFVGAERLREMNLLEAKS